MRQRPKSASLMLTRELMAFVGVAATHGLSITRDDDAGTIDVKDGDEFVIRAIQKGDKHQPWIVMFFEAGRIKWGKDAQPSSA